jgi:hypothetical protein
LNEIFGCAMQMGLHLKLNNCMVTTKIYEFENNCLFTFKKRKVVIEKNGNEIKSMKGNKNRYLTSDVADARMKLGTTGSRRERS